MVRTRFLKGFEGILLPMGPRDSGRRRLEEFWESGGGGVVGGCGFTEAETVAEVARWWVLVSGIGA